MTYSVAWDESVPAGSSDARFLDDRMRDRMTAIRERMASIFGMTTLLEFQNDPIKARSLRGDLDVDFTLRGGTARTVIKDGTTGANEDFIIDHATGDSAIRRDLTVTRNISAAGGFRSTLVGWNVTNSAASTGATEIIRADGRPLMVRAGSILSIGVVADPTQFATAGNLTVEVWKGVVNPADGTRTETATGLTAVLNTSNAAYKGTSQAIGTDTFAAGDELFVKWATDSGWLPVTLDFRVVVEVET